MPPWSQRPFRTGFLMGSSGIFHSNKVEEAQIKISSFYLNP